MAEFLHRRKKPQAQIPLAHALDDQLHQLPAEAAALEIRANQNRELATVVIGVRMQAHHAEHASSGNARRKTRSPAALDGA